MLLLVSGALLAVGFIGGSTDTVPAAGLIIAVLAATIVVPSRFSFWFAEVFPVLFCAAERITRPAFLKAVRLSVGQASEASPFSMWTR